MDMFNSYVAVISRGSISEVPRQRTLARPSPRNWWNLAWLFVMADEIGWFMADDYLLFQVANAVILVIYRGNMDDFIDERLNLND